MGSTIVTVVMLAVLAAWHVKIRRHANWKFSADARFYITSGYPLVAIAVYFLSTATTGTDWTWVVGDFGHLSRWSRLSAGSKRSILSAGLITLASAEEDKYIGPQDALHRQ